MTELADELYAVMQACDQDRRDPWTYRHAGQMAARVHRFIMREDAKVAAWMPEALAWADRVTRRARDKTAFERRARRESRS